jgi:hypothetical protein
MVPNWLSFHIKTYGDRKPHTVFQKDGVVYNHMGTHKGLQKLSKILKNSRVGRRRVVMPFDVTPIPPIFAPYRTLGDCVDWIVAESGLWESDDFPGNQRGAYFS